MSNRWTFPKYLEASKAVHRFFQILDGTEFSNNDVEFHPVKMDVEENGKTVISSVRVYKTAELESLLWQMKVLTNYYETVSSKLIEQQIEGLTKRIDSLKKSNSTGYWNSDIVEANERRDYLYEKLQIVQMREKKL